MVTEASRAVFLSYASQDAGTQKICEGLRAAGIEVWLDQSELRGGTPGTSEFVNRSATAFYSFRSFHATPLLGSKATFGWSGNWPWTARI